MKLVYYNEYHWLGTRLQWGKGPRDRWYRGPGDRVSGSASTEEIDTLKGAQNR